MSNTVTISYIGPDVEDHSISLGDLIPSLQGFYEAVRIIATDKELDGTYEIRLEAITEGSIKFRFKEVWKSIGQNDKQLQVIGTWGGMFLLAIPIIKDVVSTKTHIANQPVRNVSVENGNVNITNISGDVLKVTPEAYYYSQDPKFMGTVSKFVRPLDSGKIDKTKIEYEHDGEKIDTTVVESQKPYLTPVETKTTVEKVLSLQGKLLSLNKSTNSGTFVLTDGKSMRYKFATEHPQTLYLDFAYNGIVQVTGLVKSNAEGTYTSIEISEVKKLQMEMFEGPEIANGFEN